MSPRHDVSEERRGQILDAAEKVFADKGLAKARMDDIVAEAGLSKGALYWYYKGKDAIIRAILDRVFAGEIREAEALVDAPGSASDRMRLFVGYAVREYVRLEHLASLAYEFIALGARSKTVRSAIMGYFRHYLDILGQIIQQGIDSGEFVPCDVETASISLVCMYEGIAMLWFIDSSVVDWDRMALVPLETFLDGLKSKDA